METYLHPGDLLAAAPEEAPAEPWWVLHTRPRAEKAPARKLLGSRRRFFLPLYRKQWRSSGRLLSSHLPLFPGYLFLCDDHDVWLDALTTNQVAKTFPVPDPARLYADLVRVHQLMQAGMTMTPEERLVPGTPVEITGGPLAGVKGVVIRRGSQRRFLVEVAFIQRGVSIEVDGWTLQPLSAAADREEAFANQR
jgi:transcriptional antiterminator RfaH